MKRNKLVIGDDPSAIQLRSLARLVQECGSEFCEQMFAALIEGILDFHDGPLYERPVVQQGQLRGPADWNAQIVHPIQRPVCDARHGGKRQRESNSTVNYLVLY